MAYGRRTYSRYGRYYRRRFYRRKRYLSRIPRPRSYATKCKMDNLMNVVVSQGGNVVNMFYNLYVILQGCYGWDNLVVMYGACKISFVKAQINVYTASAQDTRKKIYYAFYPGYVGSLLGTSRVIACNNVGYGSYQGLVKKMLWRSDGSSGSLRGYGTPIPTAEVNQLTGEICINSETDGYLQGVAQQDTKVATLRVTLYVEFYSSLV